MTPDAAPACPDRRAANRALRAEDLAARRARFASRPPMIQLEPTSRCNLACPICARNYFDRERNPAGDLSDDVLARVAPFFPDAETVVLGGYGEPLLGEKVWEILAAAKGAGCAVEMISNGTLLTEAAAHRLVTMGVDRLVVSVDASSDEKMRALRGIDLRDVVDRLMGLAEIKRVHRTPRPEVEVNFTASRANVEDLAPLVDIAEQVGARGVRVQLQKVYAEDQRERPLLLDRAQAQREFARATDRARAAGIRLALPALDGRTRECRQPLDLLFVRWNGDARGCCSAVFENDAYNFPIGSVLRDDLPALWNAPAMIAYREALFAGDEAALPANCRRCAFRTDDLAAQYRFLGDTARTEEP
jgi:MoaA/NifB/PqqE/SkfB family radical SAM enzyme